MKDKDDIIFSKVDFIFILILSLILLIKFSTYILAFIIIFLFCKYLRLGCIISIVISILTAILINS